MYLVNSENKHFFFHFLQYGLLIFLFVHYLISLIWNWLSTGSGNVRCAFNLNMIFLKNHVLH